LLCTIIGSVTSYPIFAFVNFFFVEDLHSVFFAFIIATFEYSSIVIIIVLFFVYYFSSTFLRLVESVFDYYFISPAVDSQIVYFECFVKNFIDYLIVNYYLLIVEFLYFFHSI